MASNALSNDWSEHRSPLVTVGVPVRNGEDMVGRAIASLRAQTHTNLEILVFDNASTDATVEAARAAAADDPRVTVRRHEHNVGGVANFSALLSAARGEYFMWAAHDDQWEPTFVERLVGELETHPESSAAMSAVRHQRPNGEICDIVRFEGDADPTRRSPFRVAFAAASGVNYFQYIYGLYRTAFLRAAFPGTPQVACSDALFTTRVALSTPLRYVDEVLITRHLSDLPWEEKYPDDPMGRRIAHPYAYMLTLRAAIPYLLRSSTVPLRRRPQLLIVTVRFAARIAHLAAGTIRERDRQRRAGRTLTQHS